MSAVKLNVITEPKKVAVATAHKKVVISDADLRWLVRNHSASCHALGKNYRCQVFDYS